MLVGSEGGEEGRDALQQAVVDDALVLEGFDVLFALLALLVDLVLLCADKGAFVDVGMDLDIGVIAELQVVLHGDNETYMLVASLDIIVSAEDAELECCFAIRHIPICCSRPAY